MYQIENDEIKVIISDFDGTLHAHYDMNISQINLKEIQQAIQDGCYFVINTGNLPYEMKETVERFGKITNQNKYIIACNGNGVGNYLTNSVEVINSFKHQDLLKFIEIFKQIGGLSYDLTSEDLNYIYYSNKELKAELIQLGLNQVDKDHRLDLTDEVLKNFGNCPKITLKRIDEKKKQQILDLVPTYFPHLNITATWFMHDGVDFQIAGPNKFTGIEKLLKVINIENQTHLTLDNVIYFGDHMNDLDVFKNLKYSIAVDNAIPEVKKFAYDTTISASDGGVGKYLEKIKVSN